MKNIAAFLDIDGTLYRDSLMIEHFKKLIKYELYDEKEWFNHVQKAFLNWDKRQGNYDDYLDEICELYVKYITGLNTTCLDFTSTQVIKLKADRVYKYTRSRIKWHLRQGHKVIFISGSPDFLVEKMAKKYKVDDFRGSGYTMENGKLTGEVIPMWDSESKNKAIQEFTEKYDIDLNNSFAYGDTNGDFNMLKQVGNPIAINPSKELLLKIKENPLLSKTASIIIERKDIIYKLPSSVEILEF